MINNFDPIFQDRSPMINGNTRSQDQKKYYHPNGAIYLIKAKELFNGVKTFYQDAIPYLMTREESVDIDNPIDIRVAEAILENRSQK